MGRNTKISLVMRALKSGKKISSVAVAFLCIFSFSLESGEKASNDSSLASAPAVPLAHSSCWTAEASWQQRMICTLPDSLCSLSMMVAKRPKNHSHAFSISDLTACWLALATQNPGDWAGVSPVKSLVPQTTVCCSVLVGKHRRRCPLHKPAICLCLSTAS